MALLLLLLLSLPLVAESRTKQLYVSKRSGRGEVSPLTARASSAPAPPPRLGRTDTERLVGGEYTPAGASNNLWWAFFERYASQVAADLGNAKRRLGISVVRMFLHSLLFEADPQGLLASMDAFLGIADGVGLKAGFVFFDSCWSATNASTTVECEETPGVHNSCWMQSPQAADRSSVGRYEAYVSNVTARFASDARVAWFEIYNEPANDPFVLALRDAGFRWATAQSPLAPVMSCWSDNADTEVVDVHAYDTDFASSWAVSAYSNEAKGAIFTEAGARDFEAPFGGDAGSPLAVLRFLETLRARRDAGLAPYVPGAMLAWELMVGNSNTRWHWGSAPGTKEPAIPWCGMLFPDGTPVSHAEAGALRRYMGGADEFLAFDHFAGPVTTTLADGDPFLTLRAGATYWASPAPGADLGGDVLVEVSLRPAFAGGSDDSTGAQGEVELVLRASNASAAEPPLPPPPPPPYAARRDACSSSVLPNENPCAGAPGETNFVVPPAAPDPVDVCRAACCSAGAGACGAWIVLPGMKFADKNCSCSDAAPCTCCWLKPASCEGAAPFENATAGFIAQPPGPPAPALAGYAVSVNYSAPQPLLSLWRRAGGGAAPALLGSFDISALENGVVDGWSMLRVLVRGIGASLKIEVYFNPSVKETGFVGNSSDAGRAFTPPPPRISVVDPSPLAGGGLALAAGVEDARIDYIAALPASVF